MPNPQTVCEVLNEPDANEWTAAMDDEINNMHRLAIFREVPRPKDRNIITPKWVFGGNSKTEHWSSTRLE